MKNIWIISKTAAPPEYQNYNRYLGMSKYLALFGYKVTIFGKSTIHNTNINLIQDNSKYIYNDYGDFTLVNIKMPSYKGNGLSRMFNMLIYPLRLWKYSAEYAKKEKNEPDIILNNLDVTAFCFPFLIARRYRCPTIWDVRDLWPESLVAYGYLKQKSILARFLYYTEKQIYKHSDKIIFSMEGGYDYIIEKGLTGIVPEAKTHLINNGIDLDIFNYNKEHYQIEDSDLDAPGTFKVVYTGSIRRVNNLGLLIDVAKEVKCPNIRFLVWGDGDELPMLKQRVTDENISNVVFKGSVEKKYIPYIVSKADLNIAHSTPSAIFRFGISFNKMFDYFAAGKPVLCDFPCPYNPAIKYGAGIGIDDPTSKNIAKTIEMFAAMPSDEYKFYCEKSLIAAEAYDFKNLTRKFIDIIEEL